MANNLTDTAENLILDHINGTTAWTPTGPLKLRLMTANGTDSTAGTEVTGGSYASQTITFAASSAGAATNSNALSYTSMPSCTVVGFEVWDSNATPKRLWWIPATTSKVVNAGDTYSVAIGAISLSVD